MLLPSRSKSRGEGWVYLSYDAYPHPTPWHIHPHLSLWETHHLPLAYQPPSLAYQPPSLAYPPPWDTFPSIPIPHWYPPTMDQVYPPVSPVDRHRSVKTLPSRNYIASGKYTHGCASFTDLLVVRAHRG